MSKSIDQLKQEFMNADQEYQFALAAGDPARLVAALKAHRATFDAFNRAKKADFKKREKAGKNAV
ncbi:hypothetical protein COO91_01987 [Nostoc flagelliforme CCNUN1]|uniref:Uncharacterized protein n=1 Tax=Nostoc flagelliforme CCNUN1 TaxID=2038116 RepID=A0A2K8SL07_9NOSO|nr:hypothetical protein [Nostoc flagelliforme]AUB36088.1 hypothetical protein COO91_01987 [Nostoc flagelliforme CCNUN1]